VLVLLPLALTDSESTCLYWFLPALVSDPTSISVIEVIGAANAYPGHMHSQFASIVWKRPVTNEMK
jgi:hypothetical protein